MEEIIGSIKGHINERLNSPLLGAYVLAWVFFNYRVPLIFFSDVKVYEKVAQIDYYLHGNWDNIRAAYGVPLLAAMIYIFILPFPSALVSAWTIFTQTVLVKIQQWVLKKKVYTEDEVSEKVTAWSTARDGYIKRIEDLEARNEDFKQRKLRAEEELSAVSNRLDNYLPLESRIESVTADLALAKNQVDERSGEIYSLKGELALTQEKLLGYQSDSESVEEILIKVFKKAKAEGYGKILRTELILSVGNATSVPSVISRLINV